MSVRETFALQGRNTNLKTQKIEAISTVTLIIGVLSLMVGGVRNLKDTRSIISSVSTTSITQRYFATEQAKREGRKTYSFTTSFIPGIGIISDPQAYLDKLKTQNK